MGGELQGLEVYTCVNCGTRGAGREGVGRKSMRKKACLPDPCRPAISFTLLFRPYASFLLLALYEARSRMGLVMAFLAASGEPLSASGILLRS